MSVKMASAIAKRAAD